MIGQPLPCRIRTSCCIFGDPCIFSRTEGVIPNVLSQISIPIAVQKRDIVDTLVKAQHTARVIEETMRQQAELPPGSTLVSRRMARSFGGCEAPPMRPLCGHSRTHCCSEGGHQVVKLVGSGPWPLY